MFSGVGSVWIGTRAEMDSPWPSSPARFAGLFVSRRIVRTPRSTRICAPMPYSRRSTANPIRCWPPPCLAPDPAARRPAACGSGRCRGPRGRGCKATTPWPSSPMLHRRWSCSPQSHLRDCEHVAREARRMHPDETCARLRCRRAPTRRGARRRPCFRTRTTRNSPCGVGIVASATCARASRARGDRRSGRRSR